ncbi:MAG: MFS transporter, partial [Gammaproteobacteria bacterium]|nr:MFS transporter [Gammaproteobacteria bacterium]
LELLPAVTDVVFGGGSAEFAGLSSAAGAGAIGASVVLTRTQEPERLLRVATAAVLASSVLLLALGMTGNYWVGIVVVAGLGCSCTLCGIGVQALIQLEVDDDFRGRVLGLWGVFAIGATATGGLLLGGIARVSSISATALGSGALLLVFAVLLGGTLIRSEQAGRAA